MTRTENSHNSQGFAHIGLILAVLAVIAAVALGGWYVWHSDRDDNKSNSTTKNSNSQNEQNDPHENGRYLVIEEWEVKIPLSDEISRAYYTFSSDDLGEYVSIYDAGFDEMENANGVLCGGNNKYKFYSITRTEQDKVPSLNEREASPEYRSFPFTDDYVFGGLGAHQAPPYCANLNTDPSSEFQDDTSILEIANDKEQAFISAFNELQPVSSD